MLLDPRNGPDWDLPPPTLPRRAYVVATVPRTGSTLLCHGLWSTGCAGAPSEYLNPMQIRDWEIRLGHGRAVRWRHRPLRGPLLACVGRAPWSPERLRAYVERVVARRTGANGWFGLKIHHHHFARWFGGTGTDPEALLGPVRWIFLTRDDKVAQAVSWARALGTGRWASSQRALLPPVYVRRTVEGRLRAIAAAEHGWEAWFATRGIAPLRLTYEELDADLTATVRRVLAWLGEGTDEVQVPPPDHERQSDATSRRWIARFARQPDVPGARS